MTTGLKALSKSDEISKILSEKLKGTDIAHILILINLNEDGTVKGLSYNANGTRRSIIEILDFLSAYLKAKKDETS